MASTWSDLKIQLMATGENTGTWGSVTNANLGTAIEEAIAGTGTVTFASANQSVTLSNTTSTQTARCMRLNLAGTTGGSTRTLTVPDIEKVYIVNNTCADAVQVKNSTGSNISVPAGKTMWVYSTGSNVVDATTHLTSLTLGSALPAGSGGTGLTAPGTSGNVLTSNGSAWVSTAPSPFTTGMIMLWSGSIATIPSGWALCNGSSGTPDLRDRFIVGAGSTYAVAATGGSANAIVVSHTHTASTNTTGAHTHYTMRGLTNYPWGYWTDKNQTAGSQLNDGGASSYYMAGGSDTADAFPTNSNGNHSHTVTVDSTGSSGTNANLPPYYALAYIMKL